MKSCLLIIHVDVNLADFQGEAAPPKELSFEVTFAGIDTVLVQDDHDILHSGIQGHFLHSSFPISNCICTLKL